MKNKMNRMNRMNYVLAVIAVSMTVTLTGCGSTYKASDTYGGSYAKNEAVTEDVATDDMYTAEAIDQPAAAEESVDASAQETSDNGKGSEDLSQSVASNRKLIKRVELSVETQDFKSITSKLEKKVDSLGGYMESSNVYGNSYYNNNRQSADYTARVPVNKLDELVSEVSKISNITNKSESATDVTLSYVDTKSQKEAYEVEQKRLMEILEQAQDVDTIVALESRLTDVRYQIQSLESQLRTYDNLVDFATVTIHIQEVEIYTPDTVSEKSDFQRMTDGFVNSIQNIIKDIKNFGIGFVIALPYLIIWALIILLIIGIVKGVIKTIRNRKNRRLDGSRKESGVRDTNRETERGQINSNESLDRSEDSNNFK